MDQQDWSLKSAAPTTTRRAAAPRAKLGRPAATGPKTNATATPEPGGDPASSHMSDRIRRAYPASASPPTEVTPVIPVGLLTVPRRHQIAGFEFAISRFASGRRGLLLAMSMGTGKSLLGIMLMLALAAATVLIVCPLHVVQVWITEFQRHLGIPVIIAALDGPAGTIAERCAFAEEQMRLARAHGVPCVLIVNFEAVWREPFASWVLGQSWDVTVADEAHRIKAPGSRVSLFFRLLRHRSKYRIALTGTPLAQGPLDAYAIFRFLDTSIFGTSFIAFRSRFAVMGGFQGRQIISFQNLDELNRLMSQATFTAPKSVLDLPSETSVTYGCELGREARRIYRDLEKNLIAQVRDNVINATNALVLLLRLQQVANGVVRLDDGSERRIDGAKLRLLTETLRDIGTGEPVVVFCRFRQDLDAVHMACQELGYGCLELSGGRNELRRWQGGGAQVLAVQIQSGGTGIDLTRARYDVFFSLGFSLAEFEQAKARTHRPGQSRPVEHIRLIVRDTVDEKIMRALEQRAEVVNAILAEIRG